MKPRLDQIEERLQRFIENSIQLIPWSSREHLLARRLVNALQESLSGEESDRPVAPEVYTIYLNPGALALWQGRQDLFDALARVLYESSQDAGLSFLCPPAIRLSADSSLSLEELHVVAGQPEPPLGRTDVLPALPDDRDGPGRSNRPENAYLVLDGAQAFSLTQSVVTIGRRRDNQLVIDDPRVSRTHAQIRAMGGRYVLFDLNSTGGTFVNDQRITRRSLKPGDVISLAGFSIIYGEDAPSLKGDTGSYTASWPAQPE